METAMEALSSLITKLDDLLTGYKLIKSVRVDIRYLKVEVESMKGYVEKIANKPADQVDTQEKILVRDVIELSYDIEDSIDTFRFELSSEDKQSTNLKTFKRLNVKMSNLFTKTGIAAMIRDIKSTILNKDKRSRRYNLNIGVDKPTTPVVDPRSFSQYTSIKELVGIDETRDDLIKILMEENRVPSQKGKILSIVGFGGLGKTTLANAVYEKISANFDCYAFVSVSQTPDLDKLFKNIIYQLDRNKYDDRFNETSLYEWELINELRDFLGHKRYFVVIDDLWDISVWQMIRHALPDNDFGYIVITTTRILGVAHEIGGVYMLKPLSHNNSKRLLYGRIFGNENKGTIDDIEKCPDEALAEVSKRILEKCGGLPLAIVTMASLLASKRRNEIDWYDVYNSIGISIQNNPDMDNIRKILAIMKCPPI